MAFRYGGRNNKRIKIKAPSNIQLWMTTKTLTGHGVADAAIDIYSGNTLIASTVSDSDGNWSYTFNVVPSGDINIIQTVSSGMGIFKTSYTLAGITNIQVNNYGIMSLSKSLKSYSNSSIIPVASLYMLKEMFSDSYTETNSNLNIMLRKFLVSSINSTSNTILIPYMMKPLIAQSNSNSISNFSLTKKMVMTASSNSITNSSFSNYILKLKTLQCISNSTSTSNVNLFRKKYLGGNGSSQGSVIGTVQKKKLGVIIL